MSMTVFFCATSATAEIYTLSLHDALPIYAAAVATGVATAAAASCTLDPLRSASEVMRTISEALRSEEHTSELQSRRDLVCRLLLEKKKVGREQRRGLEHVGVEKAKRLRRR